MIRIKKMSKRIFLNMFIISSVVIALTTILTVVIVYKSFSNQNIAALKGELTATSSGVELNGVAFLKSLSGKHRITLVDSSGKVLFDNRNDINSLGNHNDREEIREARENGTGYSERYSDTLSRKTINVTKLLNNGDVLRLSKDMSTVWSTLMDTIFPMICVMVFAILIAAYMAGRVSKAVTTPINQIDLNEPDREKVYDEIEPLIDKIIKQNNQIDKQIEQLNMEHEKQDNLRRDFTANVSHELKTPLTSISGFAEIIQNGMVKEEDITRFAGKIHSEAQRLIILVGDIIKLSQLDGKDIAVKMEPIDLYETSQAVMGHLEAAAEKRNIKMFLSGKHLVITGAEQIIEEMIFNLIDNAIKYNKTGGKIYVNILKNDDGINLSVEDTGNGIKDEDIGRIFERFYRADKSHSKEIGGTGLGLSIVKHGANFHNAKVFVKSKYKEGTKITILF
ncbi:cell wall metabolism sensor histidine kinase WalK [Eubacterium sp. AF15-50]|uniref:sensor histidine kinase n=1 Tax=Eubacterium sp. AF15-50 TaxID=2293103 RepID=UPI0026736B94|nr:ATP-binding protein [Eubacterium sp. AF15-50]